MTRVFKVPDTYIFLDEDVGVYDNHVHTRITDDRSYPLRLPYQILKLCAYVHGGNGTIGSGNEESRGVGNTASMIIMIF